MSGDEADARELAQLKEQIQAIKGRMVAKGGQLKRRRGQSSDGPRPAPVVAGGPVYLPVGHVLRRKYEGSFKAEPVRVACERDVSCSPQRK